MDEINMSHVQRISHLQQYVDHGHAISLTEISLRGMVYLRGNAVHRSTRFPAILRLLPLNRDTNS